MSFRHFLFSFFGVTLLFFSTFFTVRARGSDYCYNLHVRSKKTERIRLLYYVGYVVVPKLFVRL